MDTSQFKFTGDMCFRAIIYVHISFQLKREKPLSIEKYFVPRSFVPGFTNSSCSDGPCISIESNFATPSDSNAPIQSPTFVKCALTPAPSTYPSRHFNLSPTKVHP